LERTYLEERERDCKKGQKATSLPVATREQPVVRPGSPAVRKEGVSAGEIPVDMDAFLSFKSEQYQKLYSKLQHVETDRENALSQVQSLHQELDRLEKIRSTRQPLLRILFDLCKTAQQCDSSTSDLISRVEFKELGRRLLMESLGKIQENVRLLVSGHKFIVHNMFYESEVLHLGSSPFLFGDQQATSSVRTTTTTVVATTTTMSTTSSRRGQSPKLARNQTPVRK
jgi:hypothetical protein